MSWNHIFFKSTRGRHNIIPDKLDGWLSSLRGEEIRVHRRYFRRYLRGTGSHLRHDSGHLHWINQSQERVSLLFTWTSSPLFFQQAHQRLRYIRTRDNKKILVS